VIRPIKVSGRVYVDSNANGVINTGETGVANATTFVDYNANGLAELEEPQVRTNSLGNYTLTSSREGTFNVRVIRPSGYSPTVPSSSLYSVKFAYGAVTITGRNFGLAIGAFSTASFKAPVNFVTGSNPTSLVNGDFNADGNQDVIVASNGGTSQVYFGQGNGKFTPGQQFSTGDSTRYMIAVDVSGDGKVDLIAANDAATGGATVLINNGNGTFKPRSLTT